MNPLAAIGYPLLASAALNLCFGAFLLARGNRQDPVLPYTAAMAFISGLYCTATGVAYLRASLGLSWDFYYRSAWIGWVALAPLTQAALVLRGQRRRARVFGLILYGVWGTILVLCWTTDLVEIGAVTLAPFVDRVGRFENPARALGALSLGYVLYQMQRARRASTGRRRQQLGYFLFGMMIYASAGLLLAGVPAVFSALHFDPGLVAYFSVPWMALIFYAVTRHRLFDIRVVVSRALAAALLIALLLATNVFLFRWLAPTTGAAVAVVIASLAVGAVLFLTPLEQQLHRATQLLFVREGYDYHREIRESARALASLVGVDEVLHKLLEVTRRAIGTTSGALLLEEEGRFRVKQSYGLDGSPRELSPEGALVRWLSERRQILIRDEQEMALPPAALAALDAELQPFSGEIAVPLDYQQVIKGILILGRKKNHDAFLQADVSLLETVATESAVALANARVLEELKQAVRVRDDFLSVAGHELRTPLTALQLNVQLLLRRALPPEDARARLAAADRQVARLQRLTDELLDVSRITAHRLTLEREAMDLSAVVREVAARFTEELKRSGSALELELAAAAEGSWDRVRVEQIVTNLLANAIKYGSGRPITVRVERSDGTARLTVRDRGIGIDPADQQRIFDRFERAVSQQHYGGFGLGLWITKQIVEAHGGSIVVSSEPGAGSTFVIELPSAGAGAS